MDSDTIFNFFFLFEKHVVHRWNGLYESLSLLCISCYLCAFLRVICDLCRRRLLPSPTTASPDYGYHIKCTPLLFCLCHHYCYTHPSDQKTFLVSPFFDDTPSNIRLQPKRILKRAVFLSLVSSSTRIDGWTAAHHRFNDLMVTATTSRSPTWKRILPFSFCALCECVSNEIAPEAD